MASLLAALAFALAQAAAAGEFRLLLEGEAGVRDEGSYGGLQDEELRRDEALARAGIDLQLSYALERLNLALGYFPSYERSLKDADVSGTTHRLDFGLSADLARRLRLDVRERLLSTPNLDLYAPVTTAETTAVTRRGDQLSHALDVGLDIGFRRRASLQLGVGHSLRRFEDDRLSDSEALDARIGAGFELARGRRIEATAGLGQYDYKERGDADARTLGLAYAFDLGRSNHLRLEAGAFSVDSTRRSLVPGPAGAVETVEERDSAEGWRGGAQFAQERLLFRWALGLSQDISPGAGLGRAAVVDNGFLGISVPIGRRLELGLDGNASRQSDVSSREGEDEALTEFAAGTARVAWTFVPAFRLAAGYSRVWQRSHVEPFADLSYSRYFLSLAFRIFSTGDTPREPESLGRPTDDEEPDDQ
ncbi:MAG TPA: hypothetical protein VGG03_06705 [Thermoanaerobaculia bacterium]